MFLPQKTTNLKTSNLGQIEGSPSTVQSFPGKIRLFEIYNLRLNSFPRSNPLKSFFSPI